MVCYLDNHCFSTIGFLAVYSLWLCGFSQCSEKSCCLPLFLSLFSLAFVLFKQTARVSLRERRDSINKDSYTEQRASLTSNTMHIWHTTGKYGLVFAGTACFLRCGASTGVSLPLGFYTNWLFFLSNKSTVRYSHISFTNNASLVRYSGV